VVLLFVEPDPHWPVPKIRRRPVKSTSTLLAVLAMLLLSVGCEVHVIHKDAPPPPPACRTCSGSGVLACGTCGAKGSVVVAVNCNACAGAGALGCASCKGSGAFACAKCKGRGEIAEVGVGKVLDVK